MKKMYIAPEAELLILNVEMPLAASVSTNIGIGYGGTGDDSDDPAAKEDDVQWDW
ncbi:MAG: hypothetical protein J6Y39_00670 [Bacteroidaceae bacterium]|nr:hypothetical protein [Bacteroidaceae bacterium]